MYLYVASHDIDYDFLYVEERHCVNGMYTE